MKSDAIIIDNQCNGFDQAGKATEKTAAYAGLDHKDSLRLLLCTEEMLSMVHSVTGGMEGTFWIEAEGKNFELHLTTKTVMDKEKRHLLISASTSRKNEAAQSFLGKMRDAFEEFMAADVDHSDLIPEDIMNDLPNHVIECKEWDGYEQSILQKVAEQVKVSIRGQVVDMTVIQKFE